MKMLNKNFEISDFSSVGRVILFFIQNSNSKLKLRLRGSAVSGLRKEKNVWHFTKKIPPKFHIVKTKKYWGEFFS